MRDIHYDVILIGGGIMSTTLAVMLKEIDPKLKIKIIEKNPTGIQESTGALNNAGTGHQGFCELNYTPIDENGNVDITKAIKVCESFEKSKQFWAYLRERNKIPTNSFIHSVPHMSIVHGKEDVEFLRKRFLEMEKICLFSEMEFTDDYDKISEWAPLITSGRDRNEPIAATRMKRGTDINFGELSSQLLSHSGVEKSFNETVTEIEKLKNLWFLTTDIGRVYTADFVFIGAGGATLPLLQNAKIPEAKKYGGFPVSGQWLICENPDVIKKHEAKVYGKPSIGAPPMSVPHLDTRYINGQKVLLFGPYARFSTKFLKGGSWFDLFKSITRHNIKTLLSAGINNVPLTKYLITEIFRSKASKFNVLKEYYPEARPEDWKLSVAGQRVQVIKDVDGKGVIEFGTEIVTSEDGTIAGLMGASPGASTSVKVALDVLDKCFKYKMEREGWREKINAIIPSHGKPLHEDPIFYQEIEDYTSKQLGLYKGNGMRYMRLLKNEPMKFEPNCLIKFINITKKSD